MVRMFIRWFSRWSERNRVQFTFGIWREQQLRQQRNASRKSGRLLALLNAPINITSDACTAMGCGGPAEESLGDSCSYSSSDCCDSSDYGSCSGDDQINNKCSSSSSFIFRRREVHLRWPSEYTYCMQHVLSDCCEGFYCPPIPAVTDAADGHSIGSREESDALSIGTREEKTAIQQWLLDSGLDLGRWLCFYKPVAIPVGSPPRPDCDTGLIQQPEMEGTMSLQIKMSIQDEMPIQDESRKRKCSPLGC